MRRPDATCAALLAGVLAFGCGRGNPVRPGPATSPTMAGTWSGDVNESYGGRGRLRLVIEQAQFALSGTFQLAFEQSSLNRSGQLSGNIALPNLPSRMQWSSSGFDCGARQSPQSYLQVAWTQTGDTLKGDYAGFGCVGSVTGTFEVKRE